MGFLVSDFIGTLFTVGLFLINAVAVLSEDRFLARIGWSTTNNAQMNQGYDQNGYVQEPGIKSRLIDLISAVRTLLRIPLIGINILVIIYELL